MTLILSQVDRVDADFEIKRILLGLSSIIKMEDDQLSQSIKSSLPEITESAIVLWQKSVLMNKMPLSQEKGDEIQEMFDDEDDSSMTYDEEEADEMSNKLYGSRLDEVNERDFFFEAISKK